MMQEQQTSGYAEDEIDLRELLSALWRRKWLIALITLFCAGLTAFYAWHQPDVYEVSAVITPGVIDVKANGEYIYLDSVSNIQGKITSGAYVGRLHEALGTEAKLPGLRVSIPKGSQVLRVSAEVPDERRADGLMLLDALVNELRVDYAPEVERTRTRYKNEILVRENEIRELETSKKDLDMQIRGKKRLVRENEARMNAARSKIGILDERERDLLLELKQARDRAGHIDGDQRRQLASHAVEGDEGVANLLYVTAVQQNVTFCNELRNQLDEVRLQREELGGEIAELEKDCDVLRLDVEALRLRQTENLGARRTEIEIAVKGLESRMGHIRNLIIVGSPAVSADPVSPQRVKMVVLSAVVGLLLSMLIALVAESVGQRRREE